MRRLAGDQVRRWHGLQASQARVAVAQQAAGLDKLHASQCEVLQLQAQLEQEAFSAEQSRCVQQARPGAQELCMQLNSPIHLGI